MQAPLHLPDSPILTLRTVFGTLLGLLVLGAIIGYVGFQARFLIAGPQIVIPNPPPPTTASSTVVLAGETANITRLRLNGRQIFTDQDGTFSELAALTTGANIITVEAEDRYGRITQSVHTVVQTDSNP